MNNILEDLKAYFRDTPREQVLKTWTEAKQEAPKGGPTLNDFLSHTEISYNPPQKEFFTFTNDMLNNPEYTSGCLFL